ncbi:MAG: hypothetical protein M3Z31_03320 [Pseudomonadota bacterium]|nr:hypothetical protein [Pseudomonadota bacterium]
MIRSTDQPAGADVPSASTMNPGDEAAPGTPGTGEDVCPDCDGEGQRDGRACDTCGGTGRVIKGIGGA